MLQIPDLQKSRRIEMSENMDKYIRNHSNGN